MAKTSQLVGVILMVLGGGGYVASGMASPTALIPAFFGLVISGLGYYGRHEQTRKTAMHLAMGVALVGLLGSARGLMGLPALLSGGDVERPVAVISQSVMAVVLIWYLFMGIQSFRAARR
jgi:hypothetical protein